MAKINKKKYFKMLDEIDDIHYLAVMKLEALMKEESNIDDIEFFWVDGAIVGIGNESRTMKLINRI